MTRPRQVCDLCGTAGPDVEIRYLRLVRQAVGPGVVASRWVNLQCRCCEDCAWDARQIKQRRFLVVGFMISWLFFAPCLLSPLFLLLGEKGSTRNVVVL